MTRAGKCYHRAGCTTLGSARLPVTYAAARARGLIPCKVCKPLHLLPWPEAGPDAATSAADAARPEQAPHAD
jgi:hypothetical protein